MALHITHSQKRMLEMEQKGAKYPTRDGNQYGKAHHNYSGKNFTGSYKR